jgi:hypothetical protein
MSITIVTELWRMSATELSEAIRSRQVSSPIGRTNLPSGAIRWHCESELWGATVNPWERSRTAGASSAGEAAAIATGMSPLGLGMTDSTRRFMSAFFEGAGDPDATDAEQAFITRQSVLRSWTEFFEHHPLIIAPIATEIPRKQVPICKKVK